MKKTPTTTGAHCLGCDWTAGPGPAADVDRAAEKHTAKGHPTATITTILAAIGRGVLAGVAVASAFWAALGTQLPAAARLGVMCVVITGAVLGVAALQPKKGGRT